jgi:hypothetical protein
LDLLSKRKILLASVKDLNELIDFLDRNQAGNPGVALVLPGLEQDANRVARRLWAVQKEIERQDLD